MKKIILLSTGLFLFSSIKAQVSNPVWLSDTLKEKTLPGIQNQVDCDSKTMVLPKTFTLLTSKVLTQLAPNVAGELKQGTGAALKISDDKTSAALQASFLVLKRCLLNIGVNGAITDNISSIYTGKDGLAADWGFRGSVSIPLFRGLIYKNKNTCYRLHAERDQYLGKLDSSISANLDTSRTSLQDRVYQLQRSLSTGRTARFNARSLAVTGTQVKTALDSLEQRQAIFGYGTDLSEEDIKNKLKEYVEDSVVAFEARSAKWTGYNILLLNLGGFYNSKGFKQFFPSPALFSDRFVDTIYGNRGFNIGLSLFHVGSRVNYNASLDLVLQRRSNFELPENKKYNRSYVMETAYPSGSPNTVQYTTETKKAFDSTLLPFKTFQSLDVNFQYTVFMGESRMLGINVVGQYSFSDFYKTNPLDVLAGPVLSVPNTEKAGSKLNFALMFGYRNLLDTETTSKDKFAISFFVSVPFKVFGL